MLSPEIWKAILLGIVQGIAEFLPVSSSGHLVVLGPIAGQWLGVSTETNDDLILNVVLHVGTLASILVVYRRTLVGLLKQFPLCLLIVIATIPVGIVGLLFKELLSDAFETPSVVAVGWLATAGMLLFGQRCAVKPRTESLEEMTPWQAVQVGLFQAMALVPGISRSGSTIAGGMLSGLKRDDAATFSFLIAIPAISAAALKIAMDVAESGATSSADWNWPALIAGALTSFLVGIASLKLLLRAISRFRLHWFAYYCIAMAVGTLLWELSR